MKRIAIIGGGLAGTACAYVLKQHGLEPVIYEAGESLAPGASGNPAGLYNPRLSAEQSAESEFYSAAFRLAVQNFAALKDIDWVQCGSLHLMNDDKRRKRFQQTIKSWNWPPQSMQIVDTAQASAIAGVDLHYDALYLPEAGVVSPVKLCVAYAQGVEVHLNTKIEDLSTVKADAVIVANGMGVENFAETEFLPVNAVRGQMTQVKASKISIKLKTNLCYGGYFSPATEGVHMLGATFQRWLSHNNIIPEDDADNIAGLAEIAPQLAKGLAVTGHRAALRTASKDHFPIVGKVVENIYVSTAHGSHGILSALVSAYILRAMMTGESAAMPDHMLAALAPARFVSA